MSFRFNAILGVGIGLVAAVAPSASAQTVVAAVVSDTGYFQEQGPNATDVILGGGKLNANFSASGLSGLTPTLTTGNGTVIALGGSGSDWSYQSANNTGGNAAILSSYGSGTYTFKDGNGTALQTLSMPSSTALQPNKPFISITNSGTWTNTHTANATYTVAAGQTLHFSSNNVLGTAAPGETIAFWKVFDISNSNTLVYDSEPQSYDATAGSVFEVNSTSLDLSSALLNPGDKYGISLEFDTIVNGNSLASGTNSMVFATLGRITLMDVQISAVPEPATYGWMAGGAGLVLAIAMRRRGLRSAAAA